TNPAPDRAERAPNNFPRKTHSTIRRYHAAGAPHSRHAQRHPVVELPKSRNGFSAQVVLLHCEKRSRGSQSTLPYSAARPKRVQAETPTATGARLPAGRNVSYSG